jgi:hypothetical protein
VDAVAQQVVPEIGIVVDDASVVPLGDAGLPHVVAVDLLGVRVDQMPAEGCFPSM